MPVLTDILSVERERKALADCRVIHLFREGKFLRAYEVSGWLFKRFVNDKYAVGMRTYKFQKEPVLMVGFPEDKLQKNLEHEKCQGFGVLKISEEQYDITLPSEFIPDGYDFNLFMDDFNHWKNSIPLDDSKKSASTEQKHESASALGILQDILHFPIEDKTPLECMSFLSSVRAKALSIV